MSCNVKIFEAFSAVMMCNSSHSLECIKCFERYDMVQMGVGNLSLQRTLRLNDGALIGEE